MSFLVAFAMFANATVWTVVSLLHVDPVMFVSFVLCTLLGLVCRVLPIHPEDYCGEKGTSGDHY
ncbi:unnamed protein product, partial [Arabidopsis halleri]